MKHYTQQKMKQKMKREAKAKLLSSLLLGVVLILGLVGGFFLIRTAIEDAGGFKGIAVTAGREVKDIVKQINEE